MAREDRPASDTTARPAVPGPRRQRADTAQDDVIQGDSGQGDTRQGDTRRDDTGQGDSGQGDAERARGAEAPLPERASADHVLQRTRLGAAWLAVGCFLVILVILLIFIAQNGSSVSISFLGTHTGVPLGVALVLAAVCGALLVMFAGVARIMQLRSRARRHRRAARKAARQ